MKRVFTADKLTIAGWYGQRPCIYSHIGVYS